MQQGHTLLTQAPLAVLHHTQTAAPPSHLHLHLNGIIVYLPVGLRPEPRSSTEESLLRLLGRKHLRTLKLF